MLAWLVLVTAGYAADDTLKDQSKIEPVKTSVTVIGNVAAEAPANVTVLGTQEIDAIPGAEIDDRLRNVPGFSLFRRSSSLVAHPTTQGISLRGIGSSGASRTLTLWDGLPVNDPFGGWVYWTRFDPDELERIEVNRGASTSAFGDRGMGGVIGLFSRRPEALRFHGSYEIGNKNTHDLSGGVGDLWTHWATSVNVRLFGTDGYYIIPANIRGPVDRRANVRFVTGDARTDYFSGPHTFFLKANVLAEDRQNGTSLQTNSTAFGELAAHYQWQSKENVFSVFGYHDEEQFHSVFSAITGPRAVERVTFRQTVPADAIGSAALWQHSGTGWNVLGGADVNRVHGVSTDRLVPSGERVGGGTVLQHGLFLQGDNALGPVRLFGGVRHTFTGLGSDYFSPTAGLTAGGKRLRARASVYRSFRAPTLNELYREFRAGNAITQANPALKPETLTGVEAGFDYAGETTSFRFSAFRNSLHDLITNVTLSASPAQVVRQRQNAAQALNRGFEFQAERRWRNWRGEIGYLFADSRFATRDRVPQVPRHQGSATLMYARGGTLFSVGIRGMGLQLEDATTVLPGFLTWQAAARRRLTKSLSAVASVDNLLDRDYLSARNPTPTLGTPRLWRAGIRWDSR